MSDLLTPRDVGADLDLLTRANWFEGFRAILEAYSDDRFVDREASVPIAWCYLHNAVRDHHIETERCDVPRSLLVRLDAAIGDTDELAITNQYRSSTEGGPGKFTEDAAAIEGTDD